MSDTPDKPQQRRLSDFAKDLARNNTRNINSVAASANPTQADAIREALGHRTNVDVVAESLLQTVVNRNQKHVETGKQNVVREAKAFIDEIDCAGAALESSLRRWSELGGEAITKLRSSRMSIGQELNQTLQALRDAAGFLTALDKSGAFQTLARFVELGSSLQKAYGDAGLVRLADALLVLAEAEPKS